MALVYDAQGRLVDDGTGSAIAGRNANTQQVAPGNPARAAAMQAQFNQPVTSGAPSQRNPNAINVGQAAADVVLGGLSVPGAALGDLARYRSTQALGGDTGTLQGGVNPRLDAAQNRVSGGLSQLGTATTQAFQPVIDALGGTRNTALGALGARPAATPATPATTPAGTAAATAAQPAQAAVSAADPQFLSAQESSGYTGTGIGVGAQGGEIFRREVNGVPTFYNVNANPELQGLTGATGVEVGAAVAPAPSEPTGYGGFGGGRAAEYLAQMRQQDLAQRDYKRQLTRDIERSNLEKVAMGRGSATDRAVARRGLASLDAREQLYTQGATQLQAQDLQNQGAEQTAQIGAQSQQQEAIISAQGEQAKAQATANTPANQKIAAQLQMAAAYEQAAAESTDEREIAMLRAAAERARGIAQPAVGTVLEDLEGPIGVQTPAGPVLYTKEQIDQMKALRS